MGKEVIKLEPKFPQLIKVEKLKVAAYARVSTEKDEQHNSLEAQKDYFLKFIKFKYSLFTKIWNIFIYRSYKI